MENNNMIEISGLWLNESKTGTRYMMGYMGGAIIYIFKNTYKTEEKHPDYRLLIAPKTVVNTEEDDDSDIEF